MDLDKDWEKIKTNVQELIKSVSMRVSRTAYGSDRRATLRVSGFGLLSMACYTKPSLMIY